MLKNLFRKILLRNQSWVFSRYFDFVGTLSTLSPEMIDGTPPGHNVVVFAPHCDDESLGCGGTLHKHHLRGGRITAVFMTDGSKCAGAVGQNEIVARRQQEAEQAAAILGISQCRFLKHLDRELRADATSIGETRRILDDLRPDTVYLPFFLDNHRDHMETAAIVLEALKHRPVANVYLYEVWTSLIPTHLVDVSGVIGKKMEAIAVYRSQTDIGLMAEKVKSLNHFRSLASGNRYEYAEALFRVMPENIERILNQLHARQIF